MSEKTENTAQIADVFAIVATGAMYQTLAVVGALGQKGLIEPKSVATWANFFASSLPTKDPKFAAGVRKQVDVFVGIIKAMAETPAGAGSG